MSEDYKKRSRKSKLVPRMDVDCDDYISTTESEQSHYESLLPRLKTEIKSDVIEKATESQMEFTVSLEVEEFDEEAVYDEIQELDEKNDINDNIEESKQLTHSEIKQEVERLRRKTTNCVDKQIEIEILNSWGKFNLGPVVETYHNTLIQATLSVWKYWSSQSKFREGILSYKCYICNAGWWSLMTFRDHIAQHKKVKVNIESYLHECNMIAYEEECEIKTIPIPGVCWTCMKPYNEHIINNRTSVYYLCPGCKDKYLTCSDLENHKGLCQRYQKYFLKNSIRCESDWKCDICGRVCLTKEVYDAHLIVTHLVRSDVVILGPNLLKECSRCNMTYVNYYLHECPKKSFGISCSYCYRQFQRKVVAQMHEKAVKPTTCKFCKLYIGKDCMLLEHMLRHSKNYMMVVKCPKCPDFHFINMSVAKQHMSKSHPQVKLNKKREPVKFYRIIIPRSCMRSDYISVIDIENQEVNDQQSLENPNNEEINNDIDKDYEDFVTSQDSLDREFENLTKSKFDIAPKVNKDIQDFAISQDSLDKEFESITKGNFDNVTVKREIVIKEEQMDIDEYNEMTTMQNIYDSDIDIIEDDNYVEALSKVFQVSKNLSTTVESNNTTVEEKVTVKDEYLDDDEYEDDIIVLDNDLLNATENSICKDINTDIIKIESDDEAVTEESVSNNDSQVKLDIIMHKKENTDIIDNKEDLQSIIKKEVKSEQNELIFVTKTDVKISETSECIVNESNVRKLLQRRYNCKKCPFTGFHREYRWHTENCHLRVIKRKRDENCELVSNKRGYKCTKCGFNGGCINEYVRHFIRHGLEYTECPHCLQIFENVTILINHIRNIIKRSFVKYHVINETSTTSENIKFYRCQRCLKVVEFDNFFIHWESHMVLKNIYTMEDKMDEVDKNEAKPENITDQPELKLETLKKCLDFLKISPAECDDSVDMKLCLVCGRSFNRRNDCKRHVIEHLLRDAYCKRPLLKVLKCQLCGNGFRKADMYKQHMRDHAGLPVYKCQLCNRTFSDSSNFAKHKKVHNLKVLICDICRKKFHKKQTLIKHLMEHKDQPPIECKLCHNRVFYSRTHYNKHMKTIHHRTIRFKCQVCGMSFERLKTKWDHMWDVHKERKDEADCPLCGKSFRKLQDVKNHVMREHLMKMAKHKSDDTIAIYKDA